MRLLAQRLSSLTINPCVVQVLPFGSDVSLQFIEHCTVLFPTATTSDETSKSEGRECIESAGGASSAQRLPFAYRLVSIHAPGWGRASGISPRMPLIASMPPISAICKSLERDVRSMLAEQLDRLASVSRLRN